MAGPSLWGWGHQGPRAFWEGGGKERENYGLLFLKESTKLLEEPTGLKGGGAVTQCNGQAPGQLSLGRQEARVPPAHW